MPQPRDVRRPFCAALGGETIIGPRLERGLGYVAAGSPDAASALIRAAGTGRYLWLTQRGPTPAPDGGQVIRVTTLEADGSTLDPKRLGDLRAAACAFLEGGPGGLVVLDCLEYLVLHNGPDRVARVLADLHDDITVHGGTLVLFVESRTANPRLVAWLAREFDPLPSTPATPFAQEDGMAT